MINLEELTKQVGEQRRQASVYYRKKEKESHERTAAEAREEEANDGMSYKEYMEKYDTTDYEDDVTAINMVTNFTLAIIAVAERIKP